ncbi:hypothetical protein [Streptomyces sp. NPDC003006]
MSQSPNEECLSSLPARAAQHLDQLHAVDRWSDTGDIADALDQIAKAAGPRAAGTTLTPFGWVHSTFHPTSLHIGDHGWRLLDFARAFTGPGLLDLRRHQKTRQRPSRPKSTRTLHSRSEGVSLSRSR